MVTLSAAICLAQNQYVVTTDFDATDVEYMIDDAIDTVNQLAGQSIAALTGVAGSMTGTCTRAQAPAVKTLISIMLREYKRTALSANSSTGDSSSTNRSVSIGAVSYSEGGSKSTAISAASALNNAANSPLVELFYKLIDSLKTGAVATRHFMRA